MANLVSIDRIGREVQLQVPKSVIESVERTRARATRRQQAAGERVCGLDSQSRSCLAAAAHPAHSLLLSLLRSPVQMCGERLQSVGADGSLRGGGALPERQRARADIRHEGAARPAADAHANLG